MSTTIDRSSANANVYYLGTDVELFRDLGALVEVKGLKVRGFANAQDLGSAGGAPAVLVLDLRPSPPDGPAETLLATLVPGGDPRPELICVGGEDNIEQRLWAMRAGAKGFIPSPVSVRRLAEKVVQLGGLGGGRRHRILVVEDDAAQAHYLSLMLTNAGMEPRVVADPLKVLDAMKAFRPDLVLMDLYMPGASGSELTAIIRDHDDLYDVPIVLLSSEEDLDKQLAALRNGADSFIAKPVHRKALIGTVEHRIRMRSWLKERRASANRPESAAGLVRKDILLQHMDRGLRDPERCGSGCGVLILELDNHKQVLERLGIAATERLLRQLEAQIGKRLSSEESAARLGDFTYAVLARREDNAKLQALGEKLRQSVAEIRFAADGEPLRPTASIGIGLFSPPADDAIAMVSRGRKAALEARREGGNRVRLWEPAVPVEPSLEADAAMRTLVETAIEKDGLKLQFQPIVSVERGSDIIHEVQLRLAAPGGEHIPPADFLPVARRHGLMPKIDRWVMDRALAVLEAEREERPGLRLLVHQTLETVAAEDWLPWFRDQVAGRGLIRQRPLIQFQLEDMKRNSDRAKPVLAGLGKLGVVVCIANCSATAEDLGLLTLLGVTLVKLSFRTLSDTSEKELTEVLARLRHISVAAIAAGIEDPATIARVWSCRPDYIQGNFLQMPSSDLAFEVGPSESL